MRFLPAGGGTRLELTHSGWERLGPRAPRARRGCDLGGAYVLRLWAGRRWSPIVLATDLLTLALRPLRELGKRRAGQRAAFPAGP